MNLDIMISLSFVSYYRYRFLLMDFLIFLVGWLLYLYFTYKILPSHWQEKKQRAKYEVIRDMLSFFLGIQFVCYWFLFLLILPYPPRLVHFRAPMGFVGIVYVIMLLIRVVIILLWSAFLMICWLQTRPTQIKTTGWYLVLFLFVLYFFFILCFLMFPHWNKALVVYEVFYNIRNLYLTKDPARKEKTMLYLQSMSTPSSCSLFRDEWKRTFKNQVIFPPSCS